MTRVRFAPSPTGALHIGGVRTALYNYLFAKQQGGDFILRVEDTDQTRFVPGAEDYIIAALKWCGVLPSEGLGFGDGSYAPYRQSNRMAIYQQYAQQLLEKGWAYYAFDTPDELAATRNAMEARKETFAYNAITRLNMRNSLTLTPDETATLLAEHAPHVVRFKIPEGDGNVQFSDLIRGEVSFAFAQLDDKVLLKGDGLPTYHLAHLVDDYLMRITHVIRGEEWLNSAPLHVLIYRAMGWDVPVFAHLPLIMRPEGNGKLSKRDGDRLGIPVFPLHFEHPITGDSATGYDETGFLPEAVINFMALFGWSPGDDREIMSLDEMVAAFSFEKINKAGAKFDYAKAKWVNQQYILAMPLDKLTPYVLPFLQKSTSSEKLNDAVFVREVVRLLQERCVLLTDFAAQSGYFFEGIKSYDEATIAKKWKPENSAKFEDLVKAIAELPDFSAPDFELTTKEFIQSSGLKMGEVMPILRIALTGTMAGPSVAEVAALLGKEEVVARLRNGFSHFNTATKSA